MNLTTLLQHIRHEHGGPGATVPLTSFGTMIARHLSEWPRPLSVFLGHMPAYCVVEAGTVEFRDGDPDVDGAVAAMTDRPASPPRLRADLFTAMIASHVDESWYLDLETQAIERIAAPGGEPGSPVSDQPFRYLLVPTIRTSEQIAFAKAALGEALTADQWSAVAAAGHSWARLAERIVPPQAWRAFQPRRQAEVVDRAVEWLRKHQIRPERFVIAAGGGGFRKAMSRELAHARSTAALPPGFTRHERSRAYDGDPASLLRRRLHECLDRMTLEELSRLSVPSRLLLEGD